MLRDFLRTFGAACIIAGAFLFYIEVNSGRSADASDSGKLKAELQALQSKLDITEEELANLQIATSAAGNSVGNVDTELDDAEKETSSKQNMEMVLTIEQGMNSTTVVDTLVSSEIIDDPKTFAAYLQKNDLARKIQIGEYELDSSMAIETIAAIITGTK